ncbi:MAG: BolA/IbaG family iron-sulfur metabolism protein [Endozoicomonadaceae bacterium]|nr:BolA/IbaG family iron-sulfur metabolism protein [Endozoicomonadaceae bacterium]
MEVQKRIESKLASAFAVEHMEIHNESYMHNVPPESESHFKLVLVSKNFAGKLPVKRHQMIYQLLSEEMKGDIHALALHTYTPDEWQRIEQTPESPSCKGGGKS